MKKGTQEVEQDNDSIIIIPKGVLVAHSKSLLNINRKRLEIQRVIKFKATKENKAFAKGGSSFFFSPKEEIFQSVVTECQKHNILFESTIGEELMASFYDVDSQEFVRYFATVTITSNDPNVQKSMWTSAMRHLICNIFGLSAEKDDDNSEVTHPIPDDLSSIQPSNDAIWWNTEKTMNKITTKANLTKGIISFESLLKQYKMSKDDRQELFLIAKVKKESELTK